MQCQGSFKYAVNYKQRPGFPVQGHCPACSRLFDRADLLGLDHQIVPRHNVSMCGVSQLMSDIGGL